MQTFAWVVGWLTMILLSAALVGFAVAAVISTWDAYHRKRDRWVAEETRRRVGTEILGRAYWFTEDVGAWKVLSLLGDGLAEHGQFYHDTLRDEWRRAVAEEKARTQKPVEV